MIVIDADFAERVLQADRPVLVEFWAEWCGPCHMIAPVLEEIAVERADSLLVAKLNIDENPNTARDCNVLAAPTMQLYRDGQLIATMVGARPKARILADIDAALVSEGLGVGGG